MVKDDIKGHFDELKSGYLQYKVMKLVAAFHYRNGINHEDGSIGEIEITRNELNDLLAYALYGTYKDS